MSFRALYPHHGYRSVPAVCGDMSWLPANGTAYHFNIRLAVCSQGGMIGWPSVWELSILWLGGDVVLSLCWHQTLPGRVAGLVPQNVEKGTFDVRYLFRKIDILFVFAVIFLLVLSSSRSVFWLLSYVRTSKNSLCWWCCSFLPSPRYIGPTLLPSRCLVKF